MALDLQEGAYRADRHQRPAGCTMVAVKLRIGTVVAFAIGYTLGARAGRERYVQIARLAERVGQSTPVAATVGAVGDKARAVAVLGVERTRDAIGIRLVCGMAMRPPTSSPRTWRRR